MGLLFIAVGALFGLLYLLIALLNAFRQEAKITFWDILLIFLAALLPLIGQIVAGWDGPIESLLPLAVQAVGVGLLAAGLLVGLIELIRHRERLKGSRGVLAAGAGLLLLGASFLVPLAAEQLVTAALATPTPIQVSALLSAPPTTDGPTATPSLTPTVTLTETPTITRTPRPTATATATRYQFVTRTPQPTQTLPTPCLALTKFNVNLRAAPSLDAELVLTIPFDNTVSLFGRTEDSAWWYGEYEGQAGWISGEFLTLTASCDRLPERES